VTETDLVANLQSLTSRWKIMNLLNASVLGNDLVRLISRVVAWAISCFLFLVVTC
jgi:hypothetical protein